MAKKKKEEVVEEVKTEQTTETATNDVAQPDSTDAPIFIPDIPAQMEDTVTATVTAEINVQVAEKPDTDEVLFLRKILRIQEEGCFGKHLHPIVNDRIKELKK